MSVKKLHCTATILLQKQWIAMLLQKISSKKYNSSLICPFNNFPKHRLPKRLELRKSLSHENEGGCVPTKQARPRAP